MQAVIGAVCNLSLIRNLLEQMYISEQKMKLKNPKGEIFVLGVYLKFLGPWFWHMGEGYPKPRERERGPTPWK